MDWKRAEELSESGLNAREVAEELGLDYEKTRNHLKKWRKKNGRVRENHGRATSELGAQRASMFGGQFTRSKYTFSNGVSTYEDELRIVDGQEITPELIMKAKGLKVSEWEVVLFTKNVWQQQTKDRGTVDLCQSKLSVRPKKDAGPTLEEIDRFFATKTFSHAPYYAPVRKVDPEKDVLEIDVADLHSGLLAWDAEAGENFNLQTCRDRFHGAVRDIVSRAKREDFSEIYFCALGDMLHIDNDNNTTTAGTPQQADGRSAQIFDYTFDTVNMALEILRELCIQIHYVYTAGNHDRNTGYFLVRCLEKANPDILFDSKPNPQKAIHFGNVLVGLTHGDMPTKNRGQWLLTDYRAEFGDSRWVEEHSGHYHSEQAKPINGIMCRSMPAVTGSSAWEHQQGYRSDRALQCFVWSKQNGLRETWYSYI